MPSLDPSVLDAAQLAELRETLAAADYLVDRVVAAMGPIAHAALARNHTVPAERSLAEREDALGTLIRLWPLQRPVTQSAADQPRIKIARRLRIEFVDAIDEERLEFEAFVFFRTQLDARSGHGGAAKSLAARVSKNRDSNA